MNRHPIKNIYKDYNNALQLLTNNATPITEPINTMQALAVISILENTRPHKSPLSLFTNPVKSSLEMWHFLTKDITHEAFNATYMATLEAKADALANIVNKARSELSPSMLESIEAIICHNITQPTQLVEHLNKLTIKNWFTDEDVTYYTKRTKNYSVCYAPIQQDEAYAMQHYDPNSRLLEKHMQYTIHPANNEPILNISRMSSELIHLATSPIGSLYNNPYAVQLLQDYMMLHGIENYYNQQIIKEYKHKYQQNYKSPLKDATIGVLCKIALLPLHITFNSLLGTTPHIEQQLSKFKTIKEIEKYLSAQQKEQITHKDQN